MAFLPRLNSGRDGPKKPLGGSSYGGSAALPPVDVAGRVVSTPSSDDDDELLALKRMLQQQNRRMQQRQDTYVQREADKVREREETKKKEERRRREEQERRNQVEEEKRARERRERIINGDNSELYLFTEDEQLELQLEQRSRRMQRRAEGQEVTRNTVVSQARQNALMDQQQRQQRELSRRQHMEATVAVQRTDESMEPSVEARRKQRTRDMDEIRRLKADIKRKEETHVERKRTILGEDVPTKREFVVHQPKPPPPRASTTHTPRPPPGEPTKASPASRQPPPPQQAEPTPTMTPHPPPPKAAPPPPSPPTTTDSPQAASPAAFRAGETCDTPEISEAEDKMRWERRRLKRGMSIRDSTIPLKGLVGLWAVSDELLGKEEDVIERVYPALSCMKRCAHELGLSDLLLMTSAPSRPLLGLQALGYKPYDPSHQEILFPTVERALPNGTGDNEDTEDPFGDWGMPFEESMGDGGPSKSSPPAPTGPPKAAGPPPLGSTDSPVVRSEPPDDPQVYDLCTWMNGVAKDTFPEFEFKSLNMLATACELAKEQDARGKEAADAIAKAPLGTPYKELYGGLQAVLEFYQLEHNSRGCTALSLLATLMEEWRQSEEQGV